MLRRVERDDDDRLGATPSTAVMFWLRTTYLPPKPARISWGGFGRERFETFGVGDLAEVDDEISWRHGLRARSLAGEDAERDAGYKRNREFPIRVSWLLP